MLSLLFKEDTTKQQDSPMMESQLLTESSEDQKIFREKQDQQYQMSLRMDQGRLYRGVWGVLGVEHPPPHSSVSRQIAISKN